VEEGNFLSEEQKGIVLLRRGSLQIPMDLHLAEPDFGFQSLFAKVILVISSIFSFCNFV